MQQIWEPIPGYEKRHQINRNGEVRHLKYYNGKKYCPHYVSLKPDLNRVNLVKDGTRQRFCIDYLLYITFGEPPIENKPGESWVEIIDYPDYMISNKGRILSKTRYNKRKDGRIVFHKRHIVATCVINSGYERVILRNSNGKGSFLVHRLVAKHFLQNPYNLEQVNHKDENKLNNCSDNLDWCTRIYNCNYGTNQQKRVEARRRNNNGNYGYKRTKKETSKTDNLFRPSE